MPRTLTLVCLLALCSTPVRAAAEGDKKASAADDRKALQGVWQSPTGARKELRILFLADKVGYIVRDANARPGALPDAFLALSPARLKEADGKKYFEIEVSKDYVKRVDYRFEKGGLRIGVGGAEYKVGRANTRASSDPAAKKLVGTWKVTAAEYRGKELTAKAVGLEAVVFTEDHYVVKTPDGKEVLRSFYRIDAKKKPATMDWYGMKPDFTIPLIYEVKGDEIVLAHPPLDLVPKGAKRPTSFDTKKGDTLVIRARRAR